jgi:2-methylcitrate dehydratase PrpD
MTWGDEPAQAGAPATADLARFALACRYEQLPARTVREAHRTFLNWLGCAIGASRHPTTEIALATVRRFAGPAQASVLGRAERTDVLHAAFLNGISSHTFDFDDTHLKTIIHPAGPVASAILSLAETRPLGRAVSGRDFINALVLGIEVECRIGNAIYPDHYDTGWHITGTAGVFGAAAACGRLLGLDQQRMTWALGLAATQSSGLREMFGSMSKPFHTGNAAKNGLFAALLAREGFTSSERGIEAPRGFGHVLSTKFDQSEITRNLGRTYEIDLNTYKPYACGIVIHPSIDGCAQLAKRHGLSARDIEHIDLGVHRLVLELTGRKSPRTGLESKFSVYHASACAILYGTAGEREFSDASVQLPEVIALRDRVRAEVRPGIAEHQAEVGITLKSGERLHQFVEHALGCIDRPMSDADLEAKFRDLARAALPEASIDQLIGACWRLGQSADAAALVPLARPA